MKRLLLFPFVIIGAVCGVTIGVLKRPAFALILLGMFALGAVIYGGDGGLTTPPPADQLSSWRVLYEHVNTPTQAPADADMVVRIGYFGNSGRLLHTTDLTLRGVELGSFVRAKNGNDPVIASSENEAWTEARKYNYRRSRWLVDNGKVDNTPTLVP